MPQQAPDETLPPGTLLANGRYRIQEFISRGRGRHASVYKASDLQYGHVRAIKEITAADAEVAKQFRLETEILSNVQSPNVPRSYDIFALNQRSYVVMDYVEGNDLEHLLNDSLVQRRRPLDEAQTLQWMIEIANTLSQLHTMPTPIIHRGINPENIMITPQGHPVLIGFGLAKLQERGKHTQPGARGTPPGFAPPEQYMVKGRTDARTDVYGLGATLYACLTGKDPAEAPARLLEQTGVNHGAPLERPTRLNPHISRRTEQVILKALELAPGRRQQSARELHDELREALAALNGVTQASTQVMAPNVPVSSKADQGGGKRAAVQASAAPHQSFKQPAAPPAQLGKRLATIPIFISYSTADRDLVDRLKKALGENGIDVWLDHERLTPGTPSWQVAIREGINQAAAVIYVASETAALSNYVFDEISIARNKGKLVIPFWIRGREWHDCAPIGWGGTQYTDGREEAFDQGCAALLRTLKHHTPPKQK